jgi:hypothetical protein
MKRSILLFLSLAIVLGGSAAASTDASAVAGRGAASAVDPSWVNLALGKPASASNEYPGNPPADALDGDWLTYWNSGGFPPQWIEVDLGSVQTVGEIDLGITQLPDSFTAHDVYGRADASEPWTLLHAFAGYTTDQQLLQYVLSAPQGLRYIRVETTASGSWVGWREIDVWGPPPPKLYDFVASHKRPVAGRSFTGVVVVNVDPQATTVTRVLCDAEVAKQRLRARQQRFSSSFYDKVTAIACSWRIPANAGGKTLRLWKYRFGPRVRVFNDSGQATDSSPFSWRVKR